MCQSDASRNWEGIGVSHENHIVIEPHAEPCQTSKMKVFVKIMTCHFLRKWLIAKRRSLVSQKLNTALY